MAKDGKIRVMLADDHNFARQMFASYINEHCDNMEVAGQASNGSELLELMEKETPDVVILDLEMPVMDGHKTLPMITQKFPTVKTIVLSTHYYEYFIAELIIGGACAYLPKNCFAEDVSNTINRVCEDGFYFSDKLSKQVLLTLIEDKKLQYLITDKILSDREIEVLKLICDGKLYKEAADKLNISIDTVKFHLKSIYKKTQTNSVAALVKYAIRVGITNVYQGLCPPHRKRAAHKKFPLILSPVYDFDRSFGHNNYC